jgi:ABC-type branched-subunit amino acid transport system ATPase component
MSDGPQPSLLEVVGVAKSFGGVKAVRDLSFAVPRGAVVGLIGPNGAGKSTAIEVISGFIRADAGKIIFAGREIQKWPSHRISSGGLVRTFQAPREWAGLTVMDNMLLAADPKGRDKGWKALAMRTRLRRLEDDDRRRARELLERFELLALRDQMAGELSGGQKRLLEFARIAMRQPRLVLLDEPTAGVNPVLKLRIHAAIVELSNSGVAVLRVEHDLSFVDQACEMVFVMDAGVTIAHGTLSELRQMPSVVDAYLGDVEAEASG